eukprot:TRINITY_DN4635_c0_g1_i1.p1 TRINITY_DN4635_c0_g1~~TRINITY_DN4635_c0_g1_i1.p1  ORF type:complete len:208 (-),score=23.33 TRINITY_DN4635_c0_g1_i1:27-650(-)
MENLGAILTYAIVGTLIATFCIGPGLWYVQSIFTSSLTNGTLPEWMTFAALISAVDPVATLNTFNTIGVEEDLGMIIFGEALINDAVAIVLFNTFKTFVEHPESTSLGDAIFNFFTIGIGSPLLGITHGVVASLVFKYFRFSYVKFFLETVVFITLTYSSFLVAEATHLSGIIASLVCGLVCEHYTYRNLTKVKRNDLIVVQAWPLV